MVQLTINGKQIEAPEGVTVLAAAKMAGIEIPTLCAHKELTPFGGCRLCIVEVQGFRVPIASCTLPVSNGMVINTETDALKKSRKFILSLIELVIRDKPMLNCWASCSPTVRTRRFPR